MITKLPNKIKRSKSMFMHVKPDNKIWFHKYAREQGYPSASECFDALIENLRSKSRVNVTRTKKSA